jgi:hypothetical protein
MRNRKPFLAASFLFVGVLSLVAYSQASALKLCYVYVQKTCCDAASASLSKECMAGEYTWNCPAQVTKNPLINSVNSSASGQQLRQNNGQADCEYKAPVCGSSVGTCGFGDIVTEQCTIYLTAGPACVTPVVPIIL